MSSAVNWTHVVRTQDVITYRAGRRGKRLVAEWPGLARVTCDIDGSRSRLVPFKGAPKRALAKLQGFVEALLSERRGGVGLHASAVAVAGRAIVFVGPSGAGKSTSAAELCVHHGAKLLADDAAILELRNGLVQVLPSERALYLTSASRAALGVASPSASADAPKSPVLRSNRASEPSPLHLVVALRFDEHAGPTLRRLRGRNAVAKLVDGMIRFDLTDDSARRRELDFVQNIYEQVPIVEVSRSMRSPAVAALVMRVLEEVHS